MRRILTTIPRSGTHYLKSLISAALGTAPLEKDLSEPCDLLAAASSVPTNQLIYGHFSFSRHGELLSERTFPGLRMLVLTRHPFDRLISQLAFEKALGGALPDPNKTPQELARELLLGQWDGKPWANGTVVNDFAAWHNFLLRDLVTDWLEHRSCHLVKLENVVADPLGVLPACLEFFHIALPSSEVIEIVERINFQSLSGGRVPGQIDPASHYRAGVPGEWRHVFTNADVELLKPKFELELKGSGYSLE